MNTLAGVVLALGVCGPALAGTEPEPPLWAYLAECSAVFGAVAQTGDDYAAATGDQIGAAGAVASRFLTEAEAAARAAGQQDPAGDVASVMPYLRERWDNRISRLFSVRSNLDWINYCGGLGRERGFLPLAE